jgi:hypothetical protein
MILSASTRAAMVVFLAIGAHLRRPTARELSFQKGRAREVGAHSADLAPAVNRPFAQWWLTIGRQPGILAVSIETGTKHR